MMISWMTEETGYRELLRGKRYRIRNERQMSSLNYSNSELIKNGWTRHEMFEEILRENPPREDYRPGDHAVAMVRFGLHGGLYCYNCPDIIYRPGDLVLVNVKGVQTVVTVESVGYYSEEEYPFHGVYMRSIQGPASGDLAEKYREAIEKEKLEAANIEKIRESARRELEEAKALKAEAEAEKARAAEEMAKAKEKLAEAKAMIASLEEEKEAVRAAAEQTEKAGKEARKEHERLKAAEREAAKVWKRKRPKTDNEVILDLRSVQDALDEDEEIYNELSALEDKMTKVMDKAAEIMEEERAAGYVETRIRKLYDSYLPKTIEVLEQYRNIFSSGLPAKSIAGLREDVLGAIDKSNQVYDNILESLYERDMLELFSEMKALQAMFAFEGLLDSDFDVKL